MRDAFSFGPFRLYPSKRILQKNSKVVSLGSRAFDMLVALVVRHGNVLTPEELMAIAWPGLTVEDSNVRVQIANLRRTLSLGRDGANYIANVAGRGYCFVAPVARVEPVDCVTRARTLCLKPVDRGCKKDTEMWLFAPRMSGEDCCKALNLFGVPDGI